MPGQWGPWSHLYVHRRGRAGAYPGPCLRTSAELLLRDLDAPVLRPTLGRLVARDRLRLAVAARRDARRVDPMCDHVVADGVGPPRRQALIVRVRPDRVGVAFDDGAELGVLLHRPDDFLDLLL